jgi:hypothetical protein
LGQRARLVPVGRCEPVERAQDEEITRARNCPKDAAP